MCSQAKTKLSFVIIKTGDTFAEISQHAGDFEHWIKDRIGDKNVNIDVFDPRASDDFPQVDDLLGIVVTGSHAMVTDAAPWMTKTAAFLREAVEKTVPVLGICFGHQLLAAALDGVVAAHPDGAEVGSIQLHVTDAGMADPLFFDMPKDTFAQAVHWQSVRKLPDTATLLAFSQFEGHHAYRVGRCAWGFQFHPEFTADIMRGYIHQAADALRRERQSPEKLLEMVRETSWSNQLLPRFVAFAQEHASRAS